METYISSTSVTFKSNACLVTNVCLSAGTSKLELERRGLPTANKHLVIAPFDVPSFVR